jgi:hypothetical protein
MLDIRYIVGSLIITVAVVAFAISMIVPVDRNSANANLKPRIEPSRIVEQPAPVKKAEPVKQTAAPAPAPAVNATPAPKEATAPAPAPKQIAAPAKAPAAPAPEVTGSIAEPKPAPAPKRIAPPPAKKQESPYQFQWPWLKGWQQN